jgi:hypothetical protein
MTCPFCETPAGKVAGHAADTSRVDALMAEYPALHLRPMEQREERIFKLACELDRTIAELREFMAKQQTALVLSGDRTLAERARTEAAEQHVTILRGQVEAAEADARRYRWLRESVANPVYCNVATPYGLSQLYGESLDAVIDSAIAKGKGDECK